MVSDNKTVNGRRPRLSAPDPQFATILVGEGEAQQRFVVHEQPLIQHSRFFRAALTGDFKEAHDKIVELEEDDPQIFEFFVHWLYFQRFPDHGRAADEGLEKAWISEGEHGGLGKSGNLIHLYIFADKYHVKNLTTKVIDELFYHLEDPEITLPYDEDIAYAFDHLNKESPLCRLLIDAYSYGGGEDHWIEAEVAQWSNTFLAGILRRYARIARGDFSNSRDSGLNLCDYHKHESETERQACLTEQDERV
ncbi:hypothetical protein P153DRAFT_387835 [Dothidotthia symphoricarpi CBS 119687]|uniref:BTB domain-containing protein n=1 Tax=Dothidotthia symphoricarpi CBS 119687 TaxID=1392245 RepID=A0A6A6A631_9PLEO|nr:uncharacterized protein P153DRAFT_387835 [Dothidotthia symphoricarpi CBS 119687]KAF2127290.1 hypothetical protein P153DRAFT_387835 [Dothidotthia symphoricarpi CBS 119687]